MAEDLEPTGSTVRHHLLEDVKKSRRQRIGWQSDDQDELDWHRYAPFRFYTISIISDCQQSRYGVIE